MIVLEIVLFLMLLTIAWGAWTFAPWVPTHARDISRAIALAGDIEGRTFIELGSGDGRMTLAAARAGANATGYEIAIPLFLIAWCRGKLTGSSAQFKFGDLFRTNLSHADVVFFFGMPKIIADRLRMKLEKELKPGAIIISYTFEVEGWTPVVTDKPEASALSIYKYIRP